MIPEPDNGLIAQAEIRDLKNTVAALRFELERSRGDADLGAVRAASAASAEIALLKGTVTALRDELEAERATRAEAVRHAEIARQDEIAPCSSSIRRRRSAPAAR